MIYSAQHNGKGKQHLIPDDDSSNELCGTSGVLLFTCAQYLIYENGKWYEEFNNSRMEINEAILSEYCKKCIKKAVNESKGRP